MQFPSYSLGDYQSARGPQARYVMSASSTAPHSVQQILALASEDQLQQWQELSLNYSSGQGDAVLRDNIGDFYPGLGADQIVTFAGAQEAMFCALHAILQPGDQALGITPCFEPLRLVPEAIGASVQEFSLTPQQDGWQLDLQAFLDRITAKTKLVVINFPHNPTGAHITEDMLQAIIEQCRRHDCWLFADEVFRGLEYSPEEQLPPVAASYEKGISLGVMSKAYGLGGVRIGWLACQDKQLLQRTMQIKRYLSICNGRTDEWLATIALQHANTLLQRNNSLIQQNMTLLKQSLPQLEDSLQWIEPKAGCVAFPRLLAVEAADDIADCLLQQHGVMIVPGRCFARQGLSAHFRIGFGLPNFSEAFRYFAALLSAS